jgi:hypothetical protein
MLRDGTTGPVCEGRLAFSLACGNAAAEALLEGATGADECGTLRGEGGGSDVSAGVGT